MKDTQEERMQVISGHIKNIQENGFSAFQTVHGFERLELLKWSDAVAALYGSVYRHHKGLIDDMNLLRVSKEDIKVALKIQFFGFALRNDEQAMKTITNAYINLCRFQSMSTEDARMLQELSITAVPRVNPFEPRDAQNITEQERHYMECFELFQLYLYRVEQEKESLRQDFAAFLQELSGC